MTTVANIGIVNISCAEFKKSIQFSKYIYKHYKRNIYSKYCLKLNEEKLKYNYI